MKPDIPFVEFPKIARYSREVVVVTEKIDGTNGQVLLKKKTIEKDDAPKGRPQ